ncbi:tyrosine phosphatase family-domain-containing protein [Nemania sp. FL0916]|nr:tyrosine phosphatase family-domain-containing protein [Nemania sp. FL0916]
MAGLSFGSDRGQATSAPCEGTQDTATSESYDQNGSQPIGIVSRRSSLTTIMLRDARPSGKRVSPGHPLSASCTPPINFSVVSDGLYRSGYPQAQDLAFMQGLKLKTIVTLVQKEFPDGYQEFIQVNGISHKIFDMAGTKKEEIPIDMMRSIYAVVSDRNNYPLLIHCNHGKHRTGCVVGVYRKANHWEVDRIIGEYSSFAEPKVRETDLKYITDLDLKSLLIRPQRLASLGSSVQLRRFLRFIVVVIITLFTIYPISQLDFKGHRSRSL